MRNIFRGNRVQQRQIIQGANKIENKELKVTAYIKEQDNFFILQLFRGNKVNPNIYRRYKSLKAVDKEIKYQMDMEQKNFDYKENLKKRRAEEKKILIKALTPGTIVRTSFSYNMTFNYFYKLISKDKSTYTFEILGKAWVDGDIGWTGNVKAGQGTGKTIEGKLTARGLKIKDDIANIINPEDTFYENHLD